MVRRVENKFATLPDMKSNPETDITALFYPGVFQTARVALTPTQLV